MMRIALIPAILMKQKLNEKWFRDSVVEHQIKVGQEPNKQRWSHKNQPLGGVNSNIFGIFTPKIGEDEPILTCAYFSNGWFNQQLDQNSKTKNLNGMFIP